MSMGKLESSCMFMEQELPTQEGKVVGKAWNGGREGVKLCRERGEQGWGHCGKGWIQQ